MTSQYRRPDVRQEEDELPWRRILAIALAVIVIFVVLGAWAVMILREREAALRAAGRSMGHAREGFAPRGTVSGVDLRIFRRAASGEDGLGTVLNRRKREELGRFGWADRERGLVQIPIEDAMRLVAEESQ
ncbi:hypothetical protein BE08_42655 [Sorangium cellulosum]|uniref:Uncharacterized protein n=1 Tax=Sorangium cellulosum TaxID=56 RepID=A0A150NZM9_SORCE|nr:hypothetical protein BE08_42655 [Sorangium cellulosum]